MPIVNNTCNDIAVTIIPDAPTDPATGLPVPTIAVATAGGVSVIKHDGTVVNSSLTTSITSIDVFGGALRFNTSSNLHHCNSIASLGASFVSNGTVSSGTASSTQISFLNGAQKTNGPAVSGNSVLANGVVQLRPNPSSFGKSMGALITRDYTSGWQVGDSRLAALADTVAESITATELVTNGDFSAGTTGWSLQNSASLSISSGALRITNTAAFGGVSPTPSIGLTVGKMYRLEFDYVGGTTTGLSMNSAAGQSISFTTSAGRKSATFMALSANFFIFIDGVNGSYGDIDNVSCVQCDADRSVKANGLNIIGTLTKSAVASGAQLVGYSGFSASNYLEQPYNANLDFGTGSWAITDWVTVAATQTAQETVWCRDSATTAQRVKLYVNASGYLVAEAYDGTTSRTATGTVSVRDGVRRLVEVSYLLGTLTITVNGAVYATATGTALLTLNNATAVFRVGLDSQGANPATNITQAMLRISATPASADQIAHIYRTELPLFQAGAQCTIAGTSAAVTALAYDDATDLVHVGTSWGRSAFKDLTRVESEATTVGALTSLSASYGTVLTGGTSAKVYQPALLLRDELRRKEEARKALGKVPVFFEHDTASFTASPSSGSPTLTASAIVGTPYVGMGITGSGIPAGTTLIAINGTTYTMSANASSTPGAVTIAQSSYQLQQGYEAKAVYSAGTLKRAGTTKDYVASADGFRQTITFGTSPGSAVWVSIMCVRV